jgi:predicted  nucleic acid-binding Zn-ribbon protein
MSMAKQLYQLQEVDLELESKELAVKQITSQLGESEAIANARNKLAQEQKRLEELSHQQRSLEWEIDDLTSKLTTAERDLYSGRIRNPKELSSLQQEAETLKARRNQLEDKDLEIMEQVDSNRENISSLSTELKTIESDWQTRQQKLTAELAELRIALVNLSQRQQLLATGIDSEALELYHKLRKGMGTAVARVEQGICRGCRISLPVNELQQARSGSLVQCSSCGRVLYLP